METLTPQQIDHLYAFTKKHYIEYYDLQTELVDHLANAIEQRWATEPNVSFEDALQAEFKKFGVFGFTELAEKREGVLKKKYHKLAWGYAKDFLKLPKILLSLSLVVVFYYIFKSEPIMMDLLLVSGMLFFAVNYVVLRYRYGLKVHRTGKAWLFENIIFKCAGFGFPVYVPINTVTIFFRGKNPEAALIINAVLFTIIVVYYYIMLYVMPSRAEQHLRETYPEYAFENVAQKV
ncbi:hypothetical protein ACLI1A_13945 [Flavobacterium sp. RHBU_3]|uniref:hypothetical protein n=1 Tax=Flavobacterium sp. RHBU_3 TaxID=3391184 RepID=UPI0039848F14